MKETLRQRTERQSGKVPGPDGIPPEIFKEGVVVIAVKLTGLMQQFGSRAQCLRISSRTPTSSNCTRTKVTEDPVITTEASRC